MRGLKFLDTARITIAMALLLFIAGCAATGKGAEGNRVSKMYYIVETSKSFDQASADLAASVKRHGFGVLHVHDLGSTLRAKGVPFEEQCKIFEVCNPKQAARVLSADMRLNMALPCRISVFTEGGKTRIGMIRPSQVLSSLSQDSSLEDVAQEVEAKTIRMIEEAR